MEEITLQYKRIAVNKWGISSYRVEGASLGGTLRFSKNAFAGDPPETLTVTALGLQGGPTKAAKALKEPRPPKAPKAAKTAGEGVPAAPAESGATVEPPSPITEPEPVQL